jgi:low temperature requirement protein LtrA
MEPRTTPVELLWDLVYVFAVTQVATLLGRDLTWAGLGRSLLVLALVWWAWSAFVWAANAAGGETPALRLALLTGTVLVFVCGLAVPQAFGDDALLFVGPYVVVRLIHLALYADASRRGNASWQAIAGFAVTVGIGMALLVVGAVVGTSGRVILWSAAAAIDYAGPAWLTRERLRGLQHIAVAHFAERYGLFVIICLGESIVSIGVGGSHEHLDAGLAGVVATGALVTVGLWWTYFGRTAAEAEERLREHDDPVLAAADAYSYLHLLLVAGIIVFAVGAKAAVAAVGDDLADGARLALCGGLALYLAGHAAFRLRLLGRLPRLEPVAALALLALYLAGGAWPAWAVMLAAAGVLGALCLAESAAPTRR